MSDNNGLDDTVPKHPTGWDQWLQPDPIDNQPARPESDFASDRRPEPSKIAAPSIDADSVWSQWVEHEIGPAPEPDPATETGEESPPPTGHKPRALIPVVGAVLAVGAVIAGSVALVEATQSPPLPTRSSARSLVSSLAPADPVLGGSPGCKPERTPNLVRGNGTGSTASGPDVILAFQHAYYVARSGTVARSFTTPDAQVSPVVAIDAGIATVPAGTGYCVSIIPANTGSFGVVITEIRPGGDVRTYRQAVSVISSNNATLVSRIGAAQ